MTNEIRDETDIDTFVQRFETGATAGGPDLLSRLHNDHGNAERLIAMYGEDLRYCHAFRKWLVWDGMRWAVDDTDQARRLGKQAMLEFRSEAPHCDVWRGFKVLPRFQEMAGVGRHALGC